MPSAFSMLGHPPLFPGMAPLGGLGGHPFDAASFYPFAAAGLNPTTGKCYQHSVREINSLE